MRAWPAWRLLDMHRRLCAELKRREWETRRPTVKAEYADKLTPREQRVIELVFEGRSVRESARQLKAAEGTIKNVRRAAYHKLGAESGEDLLARAYREGGFQLWTYTGAEQLQIWRPGEPTELPLKVPKFETAAERRQWLRAREARKES